MIPDTAMIFAAGFGTRMGDLTRKAPKPMLDLGGRPMIDHAIQILRDAGVKRLFANTHYLADLIEPHLHDKGVITFREDPILETGGGLRAALPELGDGPVITMNPDIFWQGPNPVSQLGEAWSQDKTALLMLSTDHDLPVSDFSLESGEIRRHGPFRYTGLQIIRTHRLGEISSEAFSLNAYWDLLLSDGPVHGMVYPGAWTDIGTKDALNAANRKLIR